MTDRRRCELSVFLRRGRSAVSPESVGLPEAGRRRVRGLRREDIAELAGMSESWYARFEAGHVRLSLAAVKRVADALRLDAGQRAQLIALARPDIAEITARGNDTVFSGNGSAIGFRNLARACRSVSSLAELGAAATQAVRTLCGRNTLGYMRAYDRNADDLAIVGASGEIAEALVGHRQRCSTVRYAMERFAAGHAFGEADILKSPCTDLHTRVQRVGVRAYHSVPIMGENGLHSVVGVAFRNVGTPDPVQLAALETAAAIVELTLTREHLARR